MNKIINISNKPYIVMEGLVPSNIEYTSKSNVSNLKFIMYAGTINETCGVMEVIDVFNDIKDEQLELHLYGNIQEKLKKDIQDICSQNCKIKYFR